MPVTAKAQENKWFNALGVAIGGIFDFAGQSPFIRLSARTRTEIPVNSQDTEPASYSTFNPPEHPNTSTRCRGSRLNRPGTNALSLKTRNTAQSGHDPHHLDSLVVSKFPIDKNGCEDL
jgi:hypothetical protein